jgi:hypothetical protein
VASVKKWVVQYALNGKNHHLGTFDAAGQVEAARLWDAKARELGRKGACCRIGGANARLTRLLPSECNFPRAGETRAVVGAPAQRPTGPSRAEAVPPPREAAREPRRRKPPPPPPPDAQPAAPASKRSKRPATAAAEPPAAKRITSAPPPPSIMDAATEAAVQVMRILRGGAIERTAAALTAARLLPPPPPPRIGLPPWASLAAAAPAALASPPCVAALRSAAAVARGTPLPWLEQDATPPLGWPCMLLRPVAAGGGSSASGSGGHSGSGSGSGSGSEAAKPPADVRLGSPLWDLRPPSALFDLSALRGGRRSSRDGSGGLLPISDVAPAERA